MADEGLLTLRRVLHATPEALQDPSRLDAALRPAWAGDPAELDAIVAAYRVGVTAGIIQSRDHRRSPTRQALWRERLERELQLDTALARRAILLWAEALEGVASSYIPSPAAAPSAPAPAGPSYRPPPPPPAPPPPPPYAPPYAPPGQAPGPWPQPPAPPAPGTPHGAGQYPPAAGGFTCPKCGGSGMGLAVLQAMGAARGGGGGCGGCLGCLLIILLVILLFPVLVTMGLIGGIGVAALLLWAQQNMGFVILMAVLVIGGTVLAAVLKPNRLCTRCGHRWRA